MSDAPKECHKPKILAVDDNPINLRLLIALLSEHGYSVRAVLDGASALASARSDPPDLILLDMHMPGMDGYDVCRRLKTDRRTAAIPVIFVSVDNEVVNKVHAFEVGAADYVAKPFQTAEILARIEAHIRLRQLRARVETQNQRLQQEIGVRQRAEEALQSLNQDLERIVQERTAELTHSNEDLRREIDERTKIEQALRKSETRYRRLHESMRDAFVSVDLARHIQDANPAFQEMLGYDLDELRQLTTMDLTPERWRAFDTRVVKEQVLLRGHSDIYEKEYARKDGTVFPVELRAFLLRAFLLRDDAGVPIGIWAIVRDITERKRAEAHLEAALHEKEVLLQEIYHRVKNNLQVIASLLTMQGRDLGDPSAQALFRDNTDRVHSMALVHEQLYRSADLASIAFDRFVEELLEHLGRQQAREGIAIRQDLMPLTLGVDTAIPCGLIINELISNAYKHAFPEGRNGMIGIELPGDSGGEVRVTVIDDGVGLPAAFRIERQEGLGWQLIRGLVNQIGGRVTIVPGADTRVQVEFRADTREAKH